MSAQLNMSKLKKRLVQSNKVAEYTPTQHKILEALDVSVERAKLGSGYRFGMIAVGLTTLLLPLIYLALLWLIGHTIWWNSVRAQVGGGALFHYLICGFGVVTIIFLVKPVFTMFGKNERQYNLRKDVEPFLFEYVESICKAVNAPVPKTIRVDCEANASASLRRGLLSIFGNDLTLTIGLPLVAGMNVKQMTGVLAHEFGHFSQGFGMRFSAIIRYVNFWFMKAAHERDAWDYYLMRASQSIDLRLGVFIYVARFFIWLARQMLAFIGLVGHGISCFMLREMEYDADRYETRMVGAKTFESTCNRLSSLMLAQQMAQSDVSAFYSEGRLADNFPRLAASNVGHITPEWKKKLRKFELDQKTSWFDSHPTNRDRIKSAKAEETDGQFNLPADIAKQPATVLFHDFDRISKASTVKLYQLLLGEDFDKKTLNKTAGLIEKRDAEIEARKALDRYFQVHIPLLRPLRISDDVQQPPENPKEALEELRESRETMLKHVDTYETLTKAWEFAENSWIQAAEAHALVDANLRFKASEFNVESSRKKDVKRRLKQTGQCVSHLTANMLPFEDAAEERLSLALQFLQLPGVIKRLDEGKALKLEVMQLIPDANFVSKTMRKIPNLRLSFRKLGTLFSKLDKKPNVELFQSIELQMREMHGVLSEMCEEMKEYMYPFDHADAVTTLQQYVIPVLPEEQDVMGLVYVTQDSCERLAVIQSRLFAKLAHAAEKVETAVGLPPFKERKKKDEMKK